MPEEGSHSTQTSFYGFYNAVYNLIDGPVTWFRGENCYSTTFYFLLIKNKINQDKNIIKEQPKLI
jgi:hypothetical protein